MAAAVLVALPSRSVLGKRKAAPTTFRLPQWKIDDSETGSESESEVEEVERFSAFEDDASSEEEEDDEDVDDEESENKATASQEEDMPDLSLARLRVQGGGRHAAGSSRTSLVEGKRSPSGNKQRPKRYTCQWPGCEKAYTKPVRLQEHERSHTGDRPFKCTQCTQSYMRDTHLAAHMRTHRPDSEKPFTCPEPSCGKRFWTSSQLKNHSSAAHRGDRPFACDQCEERFVKHAQLRRHVALVHCPPGTKVFRCGHEGCGKSFSQSSKLRAHERKHDPDRYACSDPSCDGQFFQTWSALQAHMREMHPPSCPYKMCAGKVFKNKGNLKAHLRMHEEEGHYLDDSADESGSDGEGRRKRRKNGGEWKCDVPGCTKSFREKGALSKHKQTAHMGLRPFKCNFDGCDYACGYKHVLQRHIQRHHPEPGSANVKQEEEESSLTAPAEPRAQSPPAENIIALLTGSGQPARRVIPCPFPDLLEHPYDPQKKGDCAWTSSRVYDLWRHLRAVHQFDCERSVLEEWVKLGEARRQ